jgi:hypothetical protein
VVGQAYTGPVVGLQNEYINITADKLNISVITPNWFIHSGSGDDAIAASISPWCPQPVGAPLRRHDGGKIRDSATLGRCAEPAPAGVPALGSADVGNDGPELFMVRTTVE